MMFIIGLFVGLLVTLGVLALIAYSGEDDNSIYNAYDDGYSHGYEDARVEFEGEETTPA